MDIDSLKIVHQKIFIMACVRFDEWMKNDVNMT
jgi:hypothetical protein